jgi:hypothetical protein
MDMGLFSPRDYMDPENERIVGLRRPISHKKVDFSPHQRRQHHVPLHGFSEWWIRGHAII